MTDENMKRIAAAFQKQADVNDKVTELFEELASRIMALEAHIERQQGVRSNDPSK